MPEKPSEYIDFEDEEEPSALTGAPLQGDTPENQWHPPASDEGEEQPPDELDASEADLPEQNGGATEEHFGEGATDADLEDGISRAAAVLKYIVEHIVDEPDEISIGATTDDRGPVLLLRVAEEDRGKVIGRQGRIVQALRTIVKAASVGSGERIGVEILD